MKSLLPFLIGTFLASCHKPDNQIEGHELTQQQQEMINQGWEFASPPEDLSVDYGIEPIYGIQDNYFDITIGEGCNLAVKIMDVKTNKCIRYVYVAENTTTTVQDIPQGVYYLKLAYGLDWMKQETDSVTMGKFTRNVQYERSHNTFDFGVKNSREEINYQLEINVVDSHLENNFKSSPISEEEFMS